MEEQHHFFTGLLWGVLLSITLWIAFLGWVKILFQLLILL